MFDSFIKKFYSLFEILKKQKKFIRSSPVKNKFLEFYENEWLPISDSIGETFGYFISNEIESNLHTLYNYCKRDYVEKKRVLKILKEAEPHVEEIKFKIIKKRKSAIKPKYKKTIPLSKKLINKLSKKFETEIRDLKLVYGKSGTCTAFLLRKILEKTLFIALLRSDVKESKLKDKDGKYLGLSSMLKLAPNIKVKNAPILTTHTAEKIKGIKFLGDTAAHNFLINVEMDEIIPQLPFITTALKELSQRL